MLKLAALLSIAVVAAAQGTGTVTGSVSDAVTHRPIQGAFINAVKARAINLTRDGTFTLKDIPAGSITIKASAPGYNPASVDLQLGVGAILKQDFELRRRAQLTGKLVDQETGQPVNGPVTLSGAGRGEALFFPRRSMFARGMFRIGDLEPGDYTLELEASDEAAVTVDPREKIALPASYGALRYPGTLHIVDGEPATVEWRISKRQAFSVSGTVELPQGMDQLPLAIGYGEPGVVRTRSFSNGRSGYFRVAGLTPGEYAVYAATGNDTESSFGHAEVNITDHDIDGVRIRMAPGFSVSGTIRMAEDGAPLPARAMVDLRPITRSAGAVDTAAYPEGGRFFLNRVSEGKYWPHLTGLPGGFAVTRILVGGVDTGGHPVTLGGPVEIAFVVTSKPGAIAGTVPDKDQAVELVQIFGEQAKQVVRSGLHGEFSFRNLAPGKYRIEGAGEIDVKPGETVAVTIRQ